MIVSLASAIQAAGGFVAAKSVFAYLQSAAMGGYGAMAVNTIIRLGAAIFGVIVGLLGFAKTATE